MNARLVTVAAAALLASCSQAADPPIREEGPRPAAVAQRSPVAAAGAERGRAAAPAKSPAVAAPAVEEATDPRDEPRPACAGEAEPPSEERVEIDLRGAPALGRADAPVTLVVFSDFECPFCARAVGTLDALEDRYGESLRVAFKNLPLPFHGRAPALARAALAADEQGRFWDYHDILFAAKGAADDASIERHATTAGLDVRRFKASLADPRVAERVEADAAEAARLGVKGTPTFFVNGRRVVGAQPVSVFVGVIDGELRAAGLPVPSAAR